MTRADSKRRWQQFSVRTMLIVVTVVALVIGAGLVVRQLFRVPMARRQAPSAPTSLETGKAYKDLFESLGRDGLERLTEDEDTGIALAAAYQPIVRQNNRWREIDESGIQEVRPIKRRREIHQALGTEFLEFLEKRTGLDPPEWWKKIARDGWYFDWNDPVSHPDPLSIENGAVVLADGQRLTLSLGALADLKDPLYGFECRECSALVDGDRVYVAAIDFDGSLSRIICFDCKTGDVVWRGDNWAMGFDNIRNYQGAISHNAEVTLQDGVVAIWGESFSSIYLEAFDAETGETLFRFCSKNWSIR